MLNAKIYVLLYSCFLFYFDEFEGNFQVQAPGGLYSEGQINGGSIMCPYVSYMIYFICCHLSHSSLTILIIHGPEGVCNKGR